MKGNTDFSLQIIKQVAPPNFLNQRKKLFLFTGSTSKNTNSLILFTDYLESR